MLKRLKKRKKFLFGLLLISLFSLQLVSLLIDTYAESDTPDNDDLAFQINADLEIDSQDLSGGQSSSLGTYYTQESGTSKRWYEEPDITGGNFSLTDMRFDFDDINTPYFNESTAQNFSTPHQSFQGNHTVNSSKIDSFTFSAGRTGQVKVRTDYNYSYPELNATNHGIETDAFDAPSGSLSSGDNTSLHSIDTDKLNFSTRYNYDREYYLENEDQHYGSSIGTLSDTRDDDSNHYLINSVQTQAEDTKNGASYDSTYVFHDGTSYNYDNGGTGAEGGDYNEHRIYGAFYYSDKVIAFTHYQMDLSSYLPLTDYTGAELTVRYAYNYDISDCLLDETHYCRTYLGHNTGDTYLFSIDGKHGSTSYKTRQKTLSINTLQSYLDNNNKIELTFFSKTKGTHTAEPYHPHSNVYIDYISLRLKAKERLSFSYDIDNIENTIIDLDFQSTESISVTDQSSYCFYTGTDFDSRFSAEQLTDLYFSATHETSFSLSIYYCVYYNSKEVHGLDTRFSFNHTGRNVLTNFTNQNINYHANITYSVSNESCFELQYGTSTEGWTKITDLNARSQTTASFSFYADFKPRLRIFCNEFVTDYPDQEALNISLNKLKLYAIFSPFSQVYINNFTYNIAGMTYHDNLTLTYDESTNYTMTNGTVDWFFTYNDLSQINETNQPSVDVPSQNITVIYNLPFNQSLNGSLSILLSVSQWTSPTEAGMQLNEDDVLPLSPKTGYYDSFSNYPSSVSITADTSLFFGLNCSANFLFESQLNLISRRVLKKTIELNSDHSIFLETIQFSEELDIYSVWIDDSSYPIGGSNRVTLNKEMEPGNEFILKVYLSEDIYKKLTSFYDTLGSGTYSINMMGTTNDYFYDDVTRSNPFFVKLPKGYYLDDMDMRFSEMRYKQNYTSNSSNDISNYGYGSSVYGDESVDYRHEYYQTNSDGYKVDESGGSGYESVYSQDFSSETGDMSHSYYPDSYNQSYSYADDTLFMENQFPLIQRNDSLQYWFNSSYDITGTTPWGITFYNSKFYITDFTEAKVYEYSSDFSSLDNTYDIGVLGGNDNPIGITHYSTSFYIVDYSDAKVYQYSSDFSTREMIYDIGALGDNDMPLDIIYNNSKFYITDTDNRVYEYSSDFGSLDNTYDLSALGDFDDPQGITAYNNVFYIVDEEGAIYNYSSDFSSYNLGDLRGFTPYGLTVYNNHLYSIDANTQYVYQICFNFQKISSDLPSSHSSFSPNQSDFTYLNGTLNSTGSLNAIDGNYTSINSSLYNSGHYYGTYSFYNDDTGSNPEGWSVSETSNCEVEVIDQKENHKKVVHLETDDGNGDNPDLTNEIDTISSGVVTIELWTYHKSNYDGRVGFYAQDSSSSAFVSFVFLNDGDIEYNDGTGYSDCGYDTIEDQWIHLKIEQDLDNDKWSVWYDDDKIIDNVDPRNNVDLEEFKISQNGWGGDNQEVWIDAIGYSWETDYSLGDNLEQRNGCINTTITNQLNIANNQTLDYLNLSYSHKTDIKQLVNLSAYNFDLNQWDVVNSSVNDAGFYANSMVLNSSYLNSTNHIKLCYKATNETDEFQLLIDQLKYSYNYTTTGGDIYSSISKAIDYSFLNRYDSDADYQKLYNITIEFLYNITKYDSNYADHFSFNDSHYLADYSFLNEVGDTDGDISFIVTNDGGGNTEASVISEKAKHQHVIDFYDNDNTDGGIWYNTITNRDEGFIQFYVYFDDTATQETYKLVDDSSVRAELIFDDDGKLKYDAGSGDIDICSFSAGEWIKVGLNFTKNNYDVLINNNYTCRDIPFKGAYNDGIDQFYVESDVSAEDYHFYMDAVDYSWLDTDWESFFYNFEFNSTNLDQFDIFFNVSNGLLELKDMNYTIKFKCLDTNDRVALGQSYSFDLPLSLDYLQQTRGNFILNYSLNFNATTDTFYNFFNQINYSYLLVRINATHETGTDTIYTLNTNSSIDQIYSLNITDALNNLSKNSLRDLSFEIYTCGNPTNLSLDNMTLFDYDSDFYNVDFVNITDTVVISHQNITIAWKSSDRYISHLEINQTFNTQEHLIYNLTLTNNTVQTQTLFNVTTGFYEFNLTFYDTYDNWERWAINYTIIATTSISTNYKNPVFINENNTVSVYIESEYSLFNIYYDNSSEYITEYANSSYPMYSYEFNFSLSYPTSRSYNISIKVYSEYNDTFWVNITNLCVIERTTIMDIFNLKSSYEQDDRINITIILKDLYNNPINAKNINYTIEAPNATIITNTSDTTDSAGEISIKINLTTNYDPGFYHLNCSFNGTTDYMSVWKMMSFEVKPIVYTITNCSEINLQVDGNAVVNNTYNYGGVDANSFNFNVSHQGELTFDLSLENITLLYNKTNNYSRLIDFEHTFDQDDGLFSYITFTGLNLTNIPDNFTYYYYNDKQTSDYTYNRTTDTLYCDNTIGDTYANLDEMSISLTYIENLESRTQLTTSPSTDDSSVRFRQQYLADMSYKYWYFTTALDIVDINYFYHNRTSTAITDFLIEDSATKYKFSMNSKTEVNDFFIAKIDYNPNWDVSYTVNQYNGTFAELEIDYKADLYISNVDLKIDLSSDNIHMDNWSLNGTQPTDSKILTVPNIDFTPSEQTLTIDGNASVPYASFDDYVNEDGFMINLDEENDLNEWYNGYLEYSQYSHSFIIPTDAEWTLDGLHYSGTTYTIDTSGYIECPGWDASISSSYIRFKVNPVNAIEREQNKNEVIYRIWMKHEAENINLQFTIETEERISIDNINLDYYKAKGLYSYDGIKYYQVYVTSLNSGLNIIRIKYSINRANPILLLPFGLALIGFAVVYYVIKNREKISLEMIKDVLGNIDYRKLKEVAGKMNYKDLKKVIKQIDTTKFQPDELSEIPLPSMEDLKELNKKVMKKLQNESEFLKL